MTSGNSTSYYIRDGLGSSVNLTSQSGQTQWTWSYEPFGQVRTETKASGSQPTNFLKFTGEYQDPTGLYHLRARQYDPQLGRFLTRDPADQTVNEAVISAYADVANRPTVMVDPSGRIFRPSVGTWAVRLAISRVADGSEFCPRPIALDKLPRTGCYRKVKGVGNGCGPGDSKNRLVPDKLTPWGNDFRDACSAHDYCYGCWGAVRYVCDRNLNRDMDDESTDLSWNVFQTITTGFCYAAASIYYKGVRRLGREVSRQNQLEACPFRNSGRPDTARCNARIRERDL
jgi:RHS repeat-associated protein